eukprot:11442599-Ditylum_brightwellii.AAC.1
MYTSAKQADQDGAKYPLVKQLLIKLHKAGIRRWKYFSSSSNITAWDNGLFDLAESLYKSGLSHGPNWGRPFTCTSPLYVSYEKSRDFDAYRNWLCHGLSINYRVHSQGWIALAHLEESEGLIVEARE